MTHHHLRANAATCHWGFFDAARAAVLTVVSGDRVTVDTVTGAPEVVPRGGGFHIPPELDEVHARAERSLPGHILTGPIAVRGARPGHVLEVRVLDVKLRQDWGYNVIRPLAGTLQDDFHDTRLMHIPLDAAQNVGRLPWGLDLPLAPFFGVMGVAPPPAFGRIASKEPRIHGGNLDNKQLTAGSTLYLPVWVPGANFSAGDGHGVQGDGEVCVTALEMCLTGTFTFVLHKGGGPSRPLLRMPRAETPTHFISMGLNEDMDQAMKQALREMIAFICARSNLSREQAYQFCSLAVDFHVTQTVNGEKGVHGMLRKGLLF